MTSVIAEAVEVLPIAEVAPLLAGGGRGPFSEAELAYARDKSDPERRLAARLAAKRAAVRLLGGGVARGGRRGRARAGAARPACGSRRARRTSCAGRAPAAPWSA